MYKVLVADDEEWIRKAIIKKVISSGLNIEVAAEASDGLEAYEQAVVTKPDIILTDIKMPYLNGLEFIEKIMQHLPSVKVIVISGYADFEYARSALQLRVFKYILKTVDDDELKETLKKAIEQIDQENQATGELISLKTKLLQRTHILQINFMHELLSGKVLDKDYAIRMLMYLDLPFDIEDNFCVLVVQLKDCPDKDITTDFTNKLESFLELNRFINFKFENQQGYNEVNIILFSSSEEPLSKPQMCDLSYKIINAFSDSILLIGISNVCTDFSQFNKAYIQAMDALKNKALLKNNKAKYIHFRDISVLEKFTNFFTTEDERTLTYYIESGNHTDIQNRICLIFENMNMNNQISTKALMKLYYEIILMLENLLNKYKLSVETVLGIDFISLVNIPKPSSLEHLKELLISFSIDVSEHLSSSKKDVPKNVLDSIKSYIEEHYFENITLDTIAQKFYISKTYFSQLFKKELNITFIAYLTKIRMDHAARMLQKDHLKVHEVARMVGYSDPLYFGQVFKKYFGVLPSEYALKDFIL